MINLQTYITESIFDVEDNIDDIDYNTSSLGKFGANEIWVTIGPNSDTPYPDKDIYNIIKDGLSPYLLENTINDIKSFDKHIVIKWGKDKNIKLSNKTKLLIYNVLERVCKEYEYALELNTSVNKTNNAGAVWYMSSWVKTMFRNTDQRFRCMKKFAKYFSIDFCPPKGDYMVHLHVFNK